MRLTNRTETHFTRK